MRVLALAGVVVVIACESRGAVPSSTSSKATTHSTDSSERGDAGPPLTEAERREMEKNLPPLQGPQYRYPQMGLFPRILVDIPALPASVVDWSNEDFAIFSGVMASGITLMLPLQPSFDTEFEDWVNTQRSPFLDALFPRISDNAMSIMTVGYVAAWWASGWISDDSEVLEIASLTSESIAVSQFYHVSLKLLIGREGPEDGTGRGTVHGFTAKYFPDGTPSGHTASVTALLSVIAEYYDSWALRGILIGGAAYMGASLIYTKEHYFSDVIFGGALGYSTGRFIVRNRSSRYQYGEDGRSHFINMLPLQLPDGGSGLQLVGAW